MEERQKELFTLSRKYKVITGESIYFSNLNYKFIEDFKKQIKILKIIGNIAYFVNLKNVSLGYSNILAYENILKIVGRIIESDITFLTEKYIPDLSLELSLLNSICKNIYEKAEFLIYSDKSIKYHLELFENDF